MRGYRAWFGAGFSILVLGVAVEAAAQSWPLPVPKNVVIQSVADFRGALILWDKKVYQIDQVTWCISPTGELGFGSFRGYDDKGQVLERSNTGGCSRSPHWASDFTDFVMGRPQDGNRRLKVKSARFAINGKGFLSFSSMDAVRAISQESYSIISSQSCNDIPTVVCLPQNCLGSCTDAGGGCFCLGGGACNAILGPPACPSDGECPSPSDCYRKNGGPCGCYIPDILSPSDPEPAPSPGPLDPNAPTKPKQIQPKNPE